MEVIVAEVETMVIPVVVIIVEMVELQVVQGIRQNQEHHRLTSIIMN